MNGFNSDVDGRAMLVATLVGLGITTVEKIIALWKRSGEDDEILAEIRTKARAHLKRWDTYGEVN